MIIIVVVIIGRFNCVVSRTTAEPLVLFLVFSSFSILIQWCDVVFTIYGK